MTLRFAVLTQSESGTEAALTVVMSEKPSQPTKKQGGNRFFFIQFTGDRQIECEGVNKSSEQSFLLTTYYTL